MCADCWRDEGSPTERTPQTGRLIQLIGELYGLHVTGGPLHSVLDDWNLHGPIAPYYDGWAPEDLDDAEFGVTTRALCDEIATLLNAMTEPQRYAALAYADGLVTTPA